MYKSKGILIAGNWKMNLTLKETEQFFSSLRDLSSTYLDSEALTLLKSRSLRACLIPSYLSLEKARSKLSLSPFPITLAAQNAHWEQRGAFTGEVSGPMLQEIGIHWALVGHSERRHAFGETDATVRKRAESLLTQGFHVILCIGETQSEREAGKTVEILTRQLNEGLPNLLSHLKDLSESKLILAYEPVWAIGTGLTATPSQAEEVHQMICKYLEDRLGAEVSNKIPILYGGSVTPDNIDSLLSCPHIDGALVGGASIKPESFLALLKAGARTLEN